MSTAARSFFTEAIEDHLALKKQNAALESAMPLARYDVVWAAAGHPHTVFPTTYEELMRITGGQSLEVA